MTVDLLVVGTTRDTTSATSPGWKQSPDSSQSHYICCPRLLPRPRPRHSRGFNNKISNKTRGQMEGEYPHRGSGLRAPARVRWENIYSLPVLMPWSCTFTLALPMAEVLAQLLSQPDSFYTISREGWLLPAGAGKMFLKTRRVGVPSSLPYPSSSS